MNQHTINLCEHLQDNHLLLAIEATAILYKINFPAIVTIKYPLSQEVYLVKKVNDKLLMETKK